MDQRTPQMKASGSITAVHGFRYQVKDVARWRSTRSASVSHGSTSNYRRSPTSRWEARTCCGVIPVSFLPNAIATKQRSFAGMVSSRRAG
jgi:hypothetical protein